MDNWTLLGLEPGAAKKAIKQAYAKRLKQTRPEDNPEGFKALHSAYQWALQNSEEEAPVIILADEDIEEKIFERRASDDTTVIPASNAATLGYVEAPEEAKENPDPSKTVLASSTTVREQPSAPSVSLLAPSLIVAASVDTQSPPPLDIPPSQEASQTTFSETILPAPATTKTVVTETSVESSLVDEEYILYRQDWQLFEAKLANLWNNATTSMDDPSQWHFLEQIPSILDLEFRQQASYKIFAQVSEANVIATQSKTLFVKPNVLNYLNHVFNWENRWQEFERYFSTEQINAVFPYLDSLTAAHANTKTITVKPQELFFFRRGNAFVIDGILIVIMSYLVTVLTIEWGWTVEQAQTLGWQVAFVNVLLVNPLLEILPWRATLGKRVLGLCVVNSQGNTISIWQSFARTYLTLLNLGLIKFIGWVNFFIARRNNMLLQDWLTRSYVVRR